MPLSTRRPSPPTAMITNSSGSSLVGSRAYFLRGLRSKTSLDLPQQPLHRSLLQFEVRRHPQGMVGVSHSGEYHAPFAILVGPAGYCLSPVLFVLQAVDVLRLEKHVLRIFVVGDEVLLVVHHEVVDTLCDRVVLVHHAHLKRA